MKCVKNTIPITRNPTRRGESKPHTGQKVTIKLINHTTLAPVAIGIIFGQYTSHGI